MTRKKSILTMGGAIDPAQALQILAQRTQAADQECIACAAQADSQKEEENKPSIENQQEYHPQLENASTHSLLKHLLKLQEQRVREYARFDHGFEMFVSVPEAQGYEALVAKTTAEFVKLSSAVNAVQDVLRDAGAGGLAGTIRSLQNLEREKLHITAQLHITRHNIYMYEEENKKISELEEKEEKMHRMRRQEEEELKGKLVKICLEINELLDEFRCELAEEEVSED